MAAAVLRDDDDDEVLRARVPLPLGCSGCSSVALRIASRLVLEASAAEEDALAMLDMLLWSRAVAPTTACDTADAFCAAKSDGRTPAGVCVRDEGDLPPPPPPADVLDEERLAPLWCSRRAW